jgi:hypothetical protein
MDSDIVSAFKARCAAQGVSMTSVISQFMQTGQPPKGLKLKTDTRPHRKKAVLQVVGILEGIVHMEGQYRDNIPEKFETRYEASDHTCEQLEEAISCLEEAF